MIELHVSEWIQVAHRLIKLPGKCQQIHGHSMHVTVSLIAQTNTQGYAIMEGSWVIDFGALKQIFREHLNTRYDHHLLLNQEDPLTQKMTGEFGFVGYLPGITECAGDPSTENIAKWIYEYMVQKVGKVVDHVTIEETATNGVTWPSVAFQVRS